MRTIKFRAWDKLEKRFIYPDKGYQGHYVLDLNGRFQNLQNGSGGDEYVVQQWTGLKDSKGVDVYEGDIIEHEYPEQPRYSRKGYEDSNLQDNISIIRWSRENEDNHPGFRIYDLIGQGGKVKVIGNIFENRELLK